MQHPSRRLAPGWVLLRSQISVEPYSPKGPENINITTLYLKTIWLRIVIFGIMDQCDIKIGLIKYMLVIDLYFMVQWLSYVCKTILWMHVILWIINQYDTKIDITWYFEGFLLGEHHIWDNGSVWHKDWPHKIYVGRWPIFRGTVILPYILTVNCKLHVFW